MKRILVPTDYSVVASNAVRYAIQFARRAGSSPVFVHVIETVKNVEQFMREDPKGYAAAIESEKAKLEKNILSQYKRLALKPAKFQMHVVMHASFEAGLLEIITSAKAAMVIMGTHGRTNLRDRVLGTNTAHMIASSPAPVLSVPSNATYSPYKKILYFTDLSQLKNELKVVKRLARELKLKEQIMHFDYGWAKSEEETRTIKRLANSGNFSTHHVSIDIPLLEHIRKYARDKDALLCLFHDHKNVFERLLTGSNPEEAPQKIHRPVLSIQRKD